MVDSEFIPLFDGHAAADDAFNLDEQIDTLFIYLTMTSEAWDRLVRRAKPDARGWYVRERERNVGPIRAALATLTRLRAAALAANPGACP